MKLLMQRVNASDLINDSNIEVCTLLELTSSSKNTKRTTFCKEEVAHERRISCKQQFMLLIRYLLIRITPKKCKTHKYHYIFHDSTRLSAVHCIFLFK